MPGNVTKPDNVTEPDNVRDNAERRRFELDFDGHTAFSEYRRAGGVLTVMHTEVPKELNGRGIGSRLVRGLLDIARSQGILGSHLLVWNVGAGQEIPRKMYSRRLAKGL